MMKNLFCILIGVVIGLGLRMIADIIQFKFRNGWPDTSRPIPDPPPADSPGQVEWDTIHGFLERNPDLVIHRATNEQIEDGSKIYGLTRHDKVLIETNEISRIIDYLRRITPPIEDH